MAPLSFTTLPLLLSLVQALPQIPLTRPGAAQGDYTTFEHPIKRVGVVGGGPCGLLNAATLIEHGFQVRLFERGPAPGGNWFYSETIPPHAAFPNKPLVDAGYVADIPKILPSTRIFENGEDGVSSHDRWRDHWNPSPIWRDLHTNSPPFLTSLPDVSYSPDIRWSIHNRDVKRHVRQYASYKGLNTNDEDGFNITSYSTRVELIRKSPDHRFWTFTLRKFDKVYGTEDIRAEYWTEEFDAVVVATCNYDSPYIPPIPGLNEWGNAFPNQVRHSREYRRPEDLKGKNVLIIGGSISAGEIARDIAPAVASAYVSMREHDPPTLKRKLSLSRIPKNVTHLPEIKSFSPLSSTNEMGVSSAQITLTNGTTLSGFDHIIFGTGFRRSNPFLVDYHNSTRLNLKERDYDVPPIITDGARLQSTHWTGHYIRDPTIAFCDVPPWSLGEMQALGVARTWSGKARLPNESRMWDEYDKTKDLYRGDIFSRKDEFHHRMYVAWLNNESLELGGRLVAPRSYADREPFVYWAHGAFGDALAVSREVLSGYDEIPRDEWTKASSFIPDGQAEESQHWDW